MFSDRLRIYSVINAEDKEIDTITVSDSDKALENASKKLKYKYKNNHVFLKLEFKYKTTFI